MLDDLSFFFFNYETQNSTVFALPCTFCECIQEQEELNDRRAVLYFIEKLAWESSFGWKLSFLI